MMNPTGTGMARARLAKYFKVATDIFDDIPASDLKDWASRIGEGYQLSWREHNFLVGRGWL